MTVSVELPDGIAEQLHLERGDASRRLLELVAVEGYRAGDLSRGEVSELLGQSFYETELLLRSHGCGPEQSMREVREEVDFLREYLGR
jgi:predicted HTH domain antitoxin